MRRWEVWFFGRFSEEEAAHRRELAWILARSDRTVLDRPSLGRAPAL